MLRLKTTRVQGVGVVGFKVAVEGFGFTFEGWVGFMLSQVFSCLALRVFSLVRGRVWRVYGCGWEDGVECLRALRCGKAACHLHVLRLEQCRHNTVDNKYFYTLTRVQKNV